MFGIVVLVSLVVFDVLSCSVVSVVFLSFGSYVFGVVVIVGMLLVLFGSWCLVLRMSDGVWRLLPAIVCSEFWRYLLILFLVKMGNDCRKFYLIDLSSVDIGGENSDL